jgi:large subunit ribosomal protein L25
MADTLQVELRDQVGTKRMRRLRQTGKVPAVLYGHKEAEQHLVLSFDQIMAVVRHGGRVVKLAGAVTNDALIREVQWDTWGKDVLHVDFIRVDASERVHTAVTVEGKGIAIGSTEGGVVEWVKHQIQIECPALAIPDILYIRLENLHLNQSIYAKDVPLPEGATLLGHPEELLVHCVRQHLEEIPVAGASGTVEPEVIKKEKKEGEEEEKK